MRKNLYLSRDERQQFRRIQQKYCLSLSAIINQIYIPIWALCKKADNMLYLTNKKTFQNYGKYKTTIKCNWKIEKGQGIHDATILTNMAKCYLNNDFKRITQDQELINKCKNQIENNLNKAYDPYWNYNDVLRANMKFWKENPQYKENKGNEK